MDGTSQPPSGPKNFGGALYHLTKTETSCAIRNAVVQTTLDGFLKLHRSPILNGDVQTTLDGCLKPDPPPNHSAGGAEASSARDDNHDAHSSSDDDVPLVKRSRFMEDEAEECSESHCNDGKDDHEGNGNIVAQKTQPLQPKSNIRDYYIPISSAMYRNNVDVLTMPDIMNLWYVEAISASKNLHDTPDEDQSATEDSSSCSSQVKRKNGYVLDDFVIASSECDSDNDDDDDVDGDNI